MKKNKKRFIIPIVILILFIHCVPLSANWLDGSSYPYEVDIVSYNEILSTTNVDLDTFYYIGVAQGKYYSNYFLVDMGDGNTYYKSSNNTYVSYDGDSYFGTILRVPSSYVISQIVVKYSVDYVDYNIDKGTLFTTTTPIKVTSSSNNSLATLIDNLYGALSLSDTTYNYYLIDIDISTIIGYANIDYYASLEIDYTINSSSGSGSGGSSPSVVIGDSNYYSNLWKTYYENLYNQNMNKIQSTVNQSALDNAYRNGYNDGSSSKFTFRDFFSGCINAILNPFINLFNNISIDGISIWLVISIAIFIAILVIILKVIFK